MKFKVIENNSTLFSHKVAADMIDTCLINGDKLTDDIGEANYILNFTSFQNPRAVRHKSEAVFVISFVADGENLKDSLRSTCYTTLIRTLSNQFIFINQLNEVWYTTPEAGFYYSDYKPHDIYRKIYPIISAHFATDNGKGFSTVFLTGYDPENKFGGPPVLAAGRNIRNGNEIVLDEAFAQKSKIKINDSLTIQDKEFKVVGLSKGTNAFVIQYAFTTINKTRSLIGFPGLTTCYIIKIKQDADKQKVKKALLHSLPGTMIYTQKEFLNNNIQEMQSGFLPILYAVASLGAIVLTVILSLILSISILEKKKDFAIMKTLGAKSGFLNSLVIKQALIIIFTAGISAIVLYFPVVEGIHKLSPEVSTENTVLQIVLVMLVAILMGLLSSFVAIQRVRKIYALEVFYERR